MSHLNLPSVCSLCSSFESNVKRLGSPICFIDNVLYQGWHIGKYQYQKSDIMDWSVILVVLQESICDNNAYWLTWCQYSGENNIIVSQNLFGVRRPAVVAITFFHIYNSPTEKSLTWVVESHFEFIFPISQVRINFKPPFLSAFIVNFNRKILIFLNIFI